MYVVDTIVTSVENSMENLIIGYISFRTVIVSPIPYFLPCFDIGI
jgi:hypothetical protein